MNNLKPCEKFPISREDRIQDLLSYIKENCDRPMTVKEFCDRWVDYSLVRQDYAKACSRVLALNAGVSTIESYNWCKSKRPPKYLPLLLRLCDITKRIQALGICRTSLDPYGREIVRFPYEFPKPRFTWNDAVVVDGKVGRVSEETLVDQANIYHLWVFPEGFSLPFGLHLSHW